MNFVTKPIANKITLFRSNWQNVGKSVTSPPVDVLFMPFMGAKEKHIKPYIGLYEEFHRPRNRHVNILVAQANFLDVASSSRGKEFSNNILDAINTQLSSKVIAHAMSVGNFMHTTCSYYHSDASYQDKIVGSVRKAKGWFILR